MTLASVHLNKYPGSIFSVTSSPLPRFRALLFVFVELHEIPIDAFLQPVYVPLNGPALGYIHCVPP